MNENCKMCLSILDWYDVHSSLPEQLIILYLYKLLSLRFSTRPKRIWIQTRIKYLSEYSKLINPNGLIDKTLLSKLILRRSNAFAISQVTITKLQ